MKDGTIFLPNLRCIDRGLKTNFDTITKYFKIFRLQEAEQNPLCLATSLCNNLLLTNGDEGDPVYVNENQLLLLNKQYPFFKLVAKY